MVGATNAVSGKIKREKRTSRVAHALFQAFADQTRLRILRLLHDEAMCVGDIIQIIAVPQPTASRHLGHLRRAGLVESRKEGAWVYYSLTPARTPLHQQLLLCLAECRNEIPQLQQDAVTAAKQRRNGGCCPSGALPSIWTLLTHR